jgi:hypothetical protein
MQGLKDIDIRAEAKSTVAPDYTGRHYFVGEQS